MAWRLSMGLNGSAVEGAAAWHGVSRLATSALALVIALMIAIAAIGGAFIGGNVSPSIPAWLTIAERATHQSNDRVAPGEADPARGDRANDDGYLDGLAKALGFDSVEQMARAGHTKAPPNLVHR
jgi:hypothetical protein